MTQILFTTYDLVGRGLLPATWREQIVTVADKFSRFVHLDGDNPDSLEPEDASGTDYYVVTGDIASEHLPWLLHLYRSDLTSLASEAFERPLEPSNDVKHGININILRGKKSRYEWHVDPNPVSGVLYVTTHLSHEGGGLVLKNGPRETTVQPNAGEFTVFEGGRIPHSVAPLACDHARISVPLLFYLQGQEQVWPAGLESYLYGKQ